MLRIARKKKNEIYAASIHRITIYGAKTKTSNTRRANIALPLFSPILLWGKLVCVELANNNKT